MPAIKKKNCQIGKILDYSYLSTLENGYNTSGHEAAYSGNYCQQQIIWGGMKTGLIKLLEGEKKKNINAGH